MIEAFNNLSTKMKSAIAIVSALSTLVGVVWAVEDRYVDESEIVQTLQQYDARLQAQITQIELDSSIKEYDRTTDQYYSAKRRLTKNPSDVELQEEFLNFKTKRESLKKELGL